MPDGYAPFLRIPPFPGHKGGRLTRAGDSDVDVQELVAAICAGRVGGTFWGPQPEIADNAILLVPDNEDQLQVMLARLGRDQLGVAIAPNMRLPSYCQRFPADCDPWHLAASAREIWVGADQELALVACLSGASLCLFGDGRFVGCDVAREAALADAVLGWRYTSPFTGENWNPIDDLARKASAICSLQGRKSSETANVTFRRSLYFVRDLKAGDIITAADFRSVRPGFGAAPKFADQIIGMQVKNDIEHDTPVLMDQLRAVK